MKHQGHSQSQTYSIGTVFECYWVYIQMENGDSKLYVLLFTVSLLAWDCHIQRQTKTLRSQCHLGLFISAENMHKFKSYIIIPSSETFEMWLESQGLFSESLMSSTSCRHPFFLWHLPLELSVSLSLTGLMRWQHGGQPLLYCSLFMLNLNVLCVPGHYLTPCPWAAAASLFNSLRWREVRDCSELLSHTASGEKHSSITSSSVCSGLLSSSLASHRFLPSSVQIAADKVWLMRAGSSPRMRTSVHDLFFCFSFIQLSWCTCMCVRTSVSVLVRGRPPVHFSL